MMCILLNFFFSRYSSCSAAPCPIGQTNERDLLCQRHFRKKKPLLLSFNLMFIHRSILNLFDLWEKTH